MSTKDIQKKVIACGDNLLFLWNLRGMGYGVCLGGGDLPCVNGASRGAAPVAGVWGQDGVVGAGVVIIAIEGRICYHSVQRKTGGI